MVHDLKDIAISPMHTAICANIKNLNEWELLPLLDDNERARANRYRKDEDYQRSVVANALKRYVLANYLDIPVETVPFETDPYGKPHCPLPDAPHFNISHSDNWVVLGFSSHGSVGVDIEFPADFSFWDIAYRVLAEQELAKLNGSDNWQDFLYFWASKESLSKAYGKGMSMDMTTLIVDGVEGRQQIVVEGKPYALTNYPWEGDGVLSLVSECEQAFTLYELLNWPATHIRALSQGKSK